MWIAIILAIAAYFFLWDNPRRAKRFVRAACFLDELSRGASVDEANGRITRLFTANSSPEVDRTAMEFANVFAQRYGGKQLPIIAEARQKGFSVDSGSRLYDVAKPAHSSQGQRLGAEVGRMVRSMILRPFLISGVAAPDRFFKDPYIAGYAGHLLKMFGADVGIALLAPVEQVAFFKSTLDVLVEKRLQSEFTAIDQGGDLFKLGSLHAALFIQAMFSPDELDQSDALVADAMVLADSRKGFLSDIDDLLYKNAEHGEKLKIDIPAAMQELTLGRHIENEYLD